MMKSYDLYGTSTCTAAHLTQAVGKLLGIQFEERESGYLGGVYYRAGDLRGEHFAIVPNDATDPDDLPEPDFDDWRVLLEVNATPRSNAIRRKLVSIPGLAHLRSRQA